MRVFITGGSGHLGSAVVPELLAAGHSVLALARSDSSAATLRALGAEIQHGSLDDLDCLRESADACDGIIHLAFRHDSMQAGDMAGAVASDLRAIEAIGESVVESAKAFVTTSGTLSLAFAGLSGMAIETDSLAAGPRIDAENFVISLAGRGVRSSVVRLPPTVHSSLDRHGFVPGLIGIAREKGYSGYVGDGSNHWPAGHTLDAARLYRLALESAPPGTRVHAVGDEGIAFHDIAERIGRHLGLPVGSIAPDDADAHFGYLGRFVVLDNPTSSALTQRLLDWHPKHPGLLADLDEGHYFA